ncbi:MAG: 30S ribosomal protein S5 [Planctomycetota bacterium]|nr:30S ribosomal protein S5 [Planctomycetota bacterium]
MVEFLDEAAAIESTTVGVYRTAATVKGGRRFSFSAMVVVGDRNGRVGIGYGKANQVPPAIEKAQKEARRRMKPYPLVGRTIPHTVEGRYGACCVRLVPASPGTGVIAGAPVRAPLEMLGVQDCLTKSFGSANSKNLVKAVINGLEQLRSREMVQDLRRLELEESEVEEAIAHSAAFATGGPAAEPEAAEEIGTVPTGEDRPSPSPQAEAAPTVEPEPAPAPKPEAAAETTPSEEGKPTSESAPESETPPKPEEGGAG